ncbi:MAG: YHYH protein [Pedobacter sp.]|nr:MAG: YHYH protein [Pedobacter sp.]
MNIIKFSIIPFLLFFSLVRFESQRALGEKGEIPAVYKKIYGATSITSDGQYLIIKSNGLPDHKSVYYDIKDSLYQEFSGTTFNNTKFRKNPNNISRMNYTFKIPLNPKVSTSHRPTPLGPIGIAVNGVPLFNQYAGPNRPLSFEINSFDQYWGHPARQGDYHYHVEPIFLTNVKLSKSALLGFLLDGFPVYGPMENNKLVAEASLDEYHGHSGPTNDYPKGIYHYHITNTDPFINGNGFYGDAGSVTK